MWPTWNSESIYFIMRFSPHFQLFYFNDRLEFCEFFEWKIKRINNADLFSQPPLVIFTKGANISGGHCKNQKHFKKECQKGVSNHCNGDLKQKLFLIYSIQLIVLMYTINSAKHLPHTLIKNSKYQSENLT